MWRNGRRGRLKIYSGFQVLVRVQSSVMTSSYDLYCFDFDGLLVDTESFHHLAYLEMLKREGAEVDLDFDQYCVLAHSADRKKLPDFCYSIFPNLNPDWQFLRKKKIAIYTEILQSKAPPLMPGVKTYIQALLAQKKQLCVVTNSNKKDTDLIKLHHPILLKIDTWITVENVKRPKPHPDGYLEALSLFQCPAEKAIGFEDTLRGIESLKAANIKPILLAKPSYPGIKDATDVEIYESFVNLVP